MFDVMSQMMIQLINILPFIIPLILILNLCAYLLWGGK